jgi:BMFP domain-containing protein YqiC
MKGNDSSKIAALETRVGKLESESDSATKIAELQTRVGKLESTLMTAKFVAAVLGVGALGLVGFFSSIMTQVWGLEKSVHDQTTKVRQLEQQIQSAGERVEQHIQNVGNEQLDKITELAKSTGFVQVGHDYFIQFDDSPCTSPPNPRPQFDLNLIDRSGAAGGEHTIIARRDPCQRWKLEAAP